MALKRLPVNSSYRTNDISYYGNLCTIFDTLMRVSHDSVLFLALLIRKFKSKESYLFETMLCFRRQGREVKDHSFRSEKTFYNLLYGKGNKGQIQMKTRNTGNIYFRRSLNYNFGSLLSNLSCLEFIFEQIPTPGERAFSFQKLPDRSISC